MKHLLQPKELFLASTRGVCLCPRRSSHFFLSGLEAFCYLLFALRIWPCHWCSAPASSGQYCPSQDSVFWAWRDTNLQWRQMALCHLQSSLEPSGSLFSVETGGKTSTEVSILSMKVFAKWMLCVLNSSSFFWLFFFPLSSWTQTLYLKVSLLVCETFMWMRSHSSLWCWSKRHRDKTTVAVLV